MDMTIKSGIPTSNFDWNGLVDKINQAAPSTNVQGATFDASTGNVTFTVGEGGAAKEITLQVPDIESPGVIDQAEFSSLVSKLSSGDTLGLTDGQVEELRQVYSELAQVELPAKTGNVLFDIYALMALMLECAQKQRDASREIRQAENEAIQTSIHNQAEAQRSAALTGMIAGLVVGVLQVAMQGFALAKSAAGTKQQMGAIKESGVHEAQQKFDNAAKDFTKESAKLESMKSDFAKGKDGVTQDAIDAQQAKVTDLGNKLPGLKQDVDAAHQKLSADSDYVQGRNQQDKWHNIGDIFGAIGSVLQGTVRAAADMQSAEATEMSADQKRAEEERDQIKDLFMQAQDVVKAVLSLFSAVLQAESSSMRDAIHA